MRVGHSPASVRETDDAPAASISPTRGRACSTKRSRGSRALADFGSGTVWKVTNGGPSVAWSTRSNRHVRSRTCAGSSCVTEKAFPERSQLRCVGTIDCYAYLLRSGQPSRPVVAGGSNRGGSRSAAQSFGPSRYCRLPRAGGGRIHFALPTPAPRSTVLCGSSTCTSTPRPRRPATRQGWELRGSVRRRAAAEVMSRVTWPGTPLRGHDGLRDLRAVVSTMPSQIYRQAAPSVSGRRM